MTQRIPENITSYDTGHQPFKHDAGRGKWARTLDFYAVSLSNSFGFRLFILNMMIPHTNGLWLLLAYLIAMVTLILPLYFMQMFFGQFSSTGCISAFRIAPLLKCIGYMSVALNVMISTYLIVSAAFPLFVIFESMQPVLPWAHCNNHFNSESCVKLKPGIINSSMSYFDMMENRAHPIHEYVDQMLGGLETDETGWSFSWRIMFCSFLVWILIGLVLWKGVEMFGKILRFGMPIVLGVYLLVTIRIFCTEHVWAALEQFFLVKDFSGFPVLFGSPVFIILAFGSGWGTVLTMASYNNFKEDIGRLSLISCLVQMAIFLLHALNFQIICTYLEENYSHMFLYSHGDMSMFAVFGIYASFFDHLSWSNFWTILFFFVIFLSQFSEGALQILTITTAIFDEYEYTRIYKTLILTSLIAVLSIISVFFCTSVGLSGMDTLYNMGGAFKILTILLEFLVVLWIYGRLRFQRDVQFMTGKPIQSWKIWMMRLFSPLLLMMVFLFYLFHFMFMHEPMHFELILTFIFLKLLPFLIMPCYIGYKIYTSTGDIVARITKLCRPTDWYPADPDDHANYENYLGNNDSMVNEMVHVNMETESVDF